ncbi:hypothetical protein MTX19_03950 [Bradyrhizobium sp. ISRA464]|nr:hypothetical protein [Bradyrhizobium sp. ISRA464]WGS31494.1 hypothetical protein MTX19_03950 [Bradyrhizobium sp. ISRA464]
MQRLRHDCGLSRSRRRQRDLQHRARHPGLGRDRARGARRARRLPRQRTLGLRLRLAAGKLARRPCPRRRGRRLAAQEAGRLAGNPHHPVPGVVGHPARRLGRDRAEGHRHRFLLGRKSLHPREIRRTARRSHRPSRAGTAVQALHQHGVQHGLCRHLARRRTRHAGRGDRACARQDAARAEGDARQQRRAGTWTIHQSAAVVDTAYHMAGATAVFAKNPFERRFRDMHAIAQQIQARDTQYEDAGKAILSANLAAPPSAR